MYGYFFFLYATENKIHIFKALKISYKQFNVILFNQYFIYFYQLILISNYFRNLSAISNGTFNVTNPGARAF